MVTHLIVDGYNVLGLRRQVGADSGAARERLLTDLMGYHHRKGLAITLVFDGWRQGLGAEHHEHRSGVHVIYSKRGERADQVIQRLTAELGAACAVVSSDREVGRWAEVHGAFVLSSAEFEHRLSETLREAPRRAVDRQAVEKQEPPERPRSTADKKGNPKKLPKALRQRQRRLKRF